VPTPEALTVAVLGGGGTIGPAVVRDLAESEEVSKQVLLDVNEERAAAVAREHGKGRAQVRTADARSGLAAHLERCDVLVNCASYRVNLEAMRACLEAGCHYIDLGGLYWLTGRQLELHDDFAETGLLALLGMGSSPGKTNVMAAAAVRRLDGPAERIDVLAAGRDLDPPRGPSYPYAVQTLVDELTLHPVIMRDCEPVEIEPLTDGGIVDFGEPIGPGATIYTLHSELRTFSDSFGCCEASFRLSLPPAVLTRVRDLVGARRERIDAAAGEAVPPSPRTVSVHVVEACSGGSRTRVRAVTEPAEHWGLGGGVVSTGAPAAAAVRLLARGRIQARGALPPERCVDPEELFAELETRGTRFELNETGISLDGNSGSSVGPGSVGSVR
jgi:saccharopine dehydrogenase (NAD+, L-lysine-forming)